VAPDGQPAREQVISPAVRAPARGAPEASGSPLHMVLSPAAALAAITAILSWVEHDGTPDLPALINQAFDTLTSIMTFTAGS
jgi:hypothetical protein